LLPRVEQQEAVDQLQAMEIPTVSKAALDVIRFEAGVPEFGSEISSEQILLEGGLNDTFSRYKGCYPGQEVIERISAYGEGKTPYKLKIYKISVQENLEGVKAISYQGEEVGRVIRTLYDPLAEKTLVAAYVASKLIDLNLNLVREDETLALTR